MNTNKATATEQLGSALTAISLPVRRFENPVPVGVTVVPVRIGSESGPEKFGVLAIRRGIEPLKGKLALPGGYLEYEDWREGLARELREETGVSVPAKSIKVLDIQSVDSGKKILIFGVTEVISEKVLSTFVRNDEVSELVVLTEPCELAFSTHTAVLSSFLSRSLF